MGLTISVIKNATIFFAVIILSFHPSHAQGLFINPLVNKPDMARELADVYFKNTYGEKVSETEKPYSVTDKGDLWVLNGNLPAEFTAGGVFTITISKNNGAVQHLSHSK